MEHERASENNISVVNLHSVKLNKMNLSVEVVGLPFRIIRNVLGPSLSRWSFDIC